MPSSLLLRFTLIVASLLHINLVNTQSLPIPSGLVGTWTTKSGKVLTGPGFYDPVNEKIIEPKLTGVSYSFTADGYYEEALYRAISNPQNPACPSAIIQWQHGTFTLNSNSSLSLTPFAVDGRQLQSQPCVSNAAVLTRYTQPEFFSKYEQLLDPYNNQQRLNLYQWDGTPSNPMWLAFDPPQMLPTSTLNPTTSVSSKPIATGARRLKERGLQMLGFGEPEARLLADDLMTGMTQKKPLNHAALQRLKRGAVDADMILYLGLGMTGIGGVLYLGSLLA